MVYETKALNIFEPQANATNKTSHQSQRYANATRMQIFNHIYRSWCSKLLISIDGHLRFILYIRHGSKLECHKASDSFLVL